MKTSNEDTREVSIEILRIIGCFLVIWAHMQLPIIENGYFYKGRLFIASLIADDVPIFMVITGFFMFRKKVAIENILEFFKYKLLNFLWKIWIPSVILVVITCIVTPIIDGNVSWNSRGMLWEQINWGGLASFVLKNSASGYAGHLWYVCFYFKLMLFLPVVMFLCQDIKSLNIIRQIYLAITLINFLIEDLSYFNGGNKIIDLSSLSIDHHFTYIFLGFEIYLIWKKERENNLSKKKIVVFAGGAYLLGVASKMGLQTLLYHVVGVDAERRFMWLECLICYITSGALLLFFSNIELKFSTKIKKIILYIASKTMWIYLFHMIVLYGTNEVREKILGILHYGTTPFTAILYYIISGGVVFGVSLIIAIIFDFIYEKIKCKIAKIGNMMNV